MYVKSFRELIVWQKAMDLVKIVYVATDQLPAKEQFSLTSQIRRSAISIPSNIAEGKQRNSIKEFNQFLAIAYGSAAELETQLLLVKDLYKKIEVDQSLKILDEVQKMLNAIIIRLKANS